ncbi:MAG: metal ABC transporter permease [Parachlamydiales bacterium]|nr:metal ABC transporter permease [Parachlamydiales bacterium]
MLNFFTDSVLRGPTIGCMLMAMAASIVGVIAFLRKRSLVGEALSHATYPGVILAVMLGAIWMPENDSALSLLILLGAFISALLGLFIIDALEKYLKVPADSALCLILSAFFGIGLTVASHIQFTHTTEYKQSLIYLYGQAATMTDIHILIYGLLALLISFAVIIFYKELQIVNFDNVYARSLKIPTRLINVLTFFLIVLAVVIGIRSVGVVLMSAMLIAPAVAARQLTHKLSHMLWIAAAIGLISGFLGNVFSVELSQYYSKDLPGRALSLPTGPMIVIVSTALCLLALLFAPERGLIIRLCRVLFFRHVCFRENLLKYFWRQGEGSTFTMSQIRQAQDSGRVYIFLVVCGLINDGWLIKKNGLYKLTRDGYLRSAHIVRLHRLWEVYLADYLGVGAERVHRNADEMEHIITPELEKQLIHLLQDPKMDPHQQPIPPRELI